MTAIGIIGTGRSLGRRIHTNEELCATTLTGTTPTWIVEKTGIHQRFIVDDDQTGSSMAFEAASEAMTNAGIQPDQVGMIVVETVLGRG